VLGLRLVKTTVNFDATDTYHLYYGDEFGHPGTILTFFPWPSTPRGRRGAGQATTTSFSVPEGSLGWWRDRVRSKGVEVLETTTRMEEDVLTFEDPDGLLIELCAHHGSDPRPPWENGPVPQDQAVRGLHSVTFTEHTEERTGSLLTETLGFELVDEEAGRFRFDVSDGGPGARLDVVADPAAPAGLVANGTVHHVAWRAPDDGHQVEWREEIVEMGLHVTPVIDRRYFHSIYFREPGGVLLEIATDPPGFTVDEQVEALGRELKLPPWLEDEREQIERALPTIKIPGLGEGEPASELP
jgi:glyoxalase family protein